MAKPSWVSLSSTTGTNNASVSVTVPSYSGRVSRSGVITGTTASNATDTTTIKQNAYKETIIADAISFNAAAIGASISVSGSSNSSKLNIVAGSSVINDVTYSIKINDVLDTSWNGSSDITIDGDPGASGVYKFNIIVSIPENKTENERIHKFIITNADNSVRDNRYITITQAAGAKNYSSVNIEQFSYLSSIQASGGTISPNLTVSQTWGWNNSNTNGGTIRITDVSSSSFSSISFEEVSTHSFNVNSSTGSVTGTNLGTTKQDARVATIKVTVTLNGITASATTGVTQVANNYSCNAMSFVSGFSVETWDIPASGGTASVLPVNTIWKINGTTVTDKSNTDIVTHTITYDSGESVIITNTKGCTTSIPQFSAINITYEGSVSAPSLGTVVTSRSQVGSLKLVATSSSCTNNDVIKYEYPVYQEANNITISNYRFPEFTETEFTKNFSSSAQESILTFTEAVDTLYTSGASATKSPSELGYTSSITYRTTTAEGFSFTQNSSGQYVISMTENTGTSVRNSFVITIYGNFVAAGNTFSTPTYKITISQAAGGSFISLEPTTINFAAEGGSSTLTVTSNDSWVLS